MKDWQFYQLLAIAEFISAIVIDDFFYSFVLFAGSIFFLIIALISLHSEWELSVLKSKLERVKFDILMRELREVNLKLSHKKQGRKKRGRPKKNGKD